MPALRLAAAAASLGGAVAFVPQGHLRAGGQPAAAAEQQLELLGAQQTAPAAADVQGRYSSSSTMGLAAVGLLATGLAAAAVPRSQRKRAAVAMQLSRNPTTAGICFPMAEKFDPLNLGSTDAKMDRYTAVEIKHGRVAMIAVIGYYLPEFFRFPGCESFKNGLGALETLPPEGWFQLVLFVGAHEILVKPREGGMGPWDFGFGTQFLEGITEEELIRRQTVERNNGRLAMMAILGCMWQDGTFGMTPAALWKVGGLYGPPVDWIVKDIPICMGSALCARKERSSRTAMRATFYGGPDGETPLLPGEKPEMSPSMPFLVYPQRLKGWVGGEKGFDPLGVTDALPVYFTREAELKHGRVAMLAVIGWIATDLGARFPGEVFQGITSSVDAHDALVKAGLMQPFLGAIGTFEIYAWWLFTKGYSGEITRPAGEFYLGAQFMPKDEEAAKTMQLKEIENGRLAMMAIGGIATQAVITGKPWPFL